MWRPLNGECQSAGGNTASLLHVGAEVPLDTFVGAREAPEAEGGRIRQLWLLADDGARVPWGGWDSERNTPVTASTAGDGRVRWIPSSIAFHFGGYFSDPACLDRAALFYAATGGSVSVRP